MRSNIVTKKDEKTDRPLRLGAYSLKRIGESNPCNSQKIQRIRDAPSARNLLHLFVKFSYQWEPNP